METGACSVTPLRMWLGQHRTVMGSIQPITDLISEITFWKLPQDSAEWLKAWNSTVWTPVSSQISSWLALRGLVYPCKSYFIWALFCLVRHNMVSGQDLWAACWADVLGWMWGSSRSTLENPTGPPGAWIAMTCFRKHQVLEWILGF